MARRYTGKRVKRDIATGLMVVPGNATLRTATQSECKRAIKRLARGSEMSTAMFRGKRSIPDKVRVKAEGNDPEQGIRTQSPTDMGQAYYEFTLLKSRKGSTKLARKPDSGKTVWNGSQSERIKRVTESKANAAGIPATRISQDIAYMADIERRESAHRVERDHRAAIGAAMVTIALEAID